MIPCIHLGKPAIQIDDNDQPQPVVFGSKGCGSCRAYECKKVHPRFALPKKTLEDDRAQSCLTCPHYEPPQAEPPPPGCGVEYAASPRFKRDDRKALTVCAVVTWGEPQAKETTYWTMNKPKRS